jgi:hypothetical protein
MQNAADGSASAQSDDRNDGCNSIVSAIACLIEQTQAGMALIESTTAVESLAGEDAGDNVVVLDDVTPRYAIANATLNACNIRLSAALHSLQEPAHHNTMRENLAGRLLCPVAPEAHG